MQLLSIYLYIFVPLLMFFAFMPSYKGIKAILPSSVITFLIFTFIVLLLLLRDINAPADMKNYNWMYEQASSFDDALTIYHGNVFFSYLMYLGNSLYLSNSFYFYLLSILYLLSYFIGLKLIFKNPKSYILALSFFAMSSTFVLLFTNVIRQGLALSLLILAIGLILNRKKISASIVLVLAIFSHFSILPIILLFIITHYLINKNKFVFTLFLLIPFLPLLGSLLLSILASIGGLFHKIESFGDAEYNNKLVYIKAFLLYASAIIYFIYGKRYFLFQKIAFKYIFILYLLIVAFIFFTLPVLLLSSRFLYYASGLMPILFTFLFYSKKNIMNINYRYLIFFIISISYGYIVYNFPSVTMQLGL